MGITSTILFWDAVQERVVPCVCAAAFDVVLASGDGAEGGVVG